MGFKTLLLYDDRMPERFFCRIEIRVKIGGVLEEVRLKSLTLTNLSVEIADYQTSFLFIAQLSPDTESLFGDLFWALNEIKLYKFP